MVSIIDMQSRHIRDEEITEHLGRMVRMNGLGILHEVSRRHRSNAGLGGPTFSANALRFAEAAEGMMRGGNKV